MGDRGGMRRSTRSTPAAAPSPTPARSATGATRDDSGRHDNESCRSHRRRMRAPGSRPGKDCAHAAGAPATSAGPGPAMTSAVSTARARTAGRAARDRDCRCAGVVRVAPHTVSNYYTISRTDRGHVTTFTSIRCRGGRTTLRRRPSDPPGAAQECSQRWRCSTGRSGARDGLGGASASSSPAVGRDERDHRPVPPSRQLDFCGRASWAERAAPPTGGTSASSSGSTVQTN